MRSKTAESGQNVRKHCDRIEAVFRSNNVILLWAKQVPDLTQSAHTYGTLLGVIWEKLWDPYGLPSEGPLGG